MSQIQRGGVILVIMGNVLFSAKAIFAKLIFVYGVDATTLMTLRLGFSFPFFAIAALLALRRRPGVVISRADWRSLSLFAFLGYYAASFLNFIGLQSVSAGLERLILFTYPTMVVVLMAVVRKVPVTRAQLWALVFTYTGIALVLVPALQDSATIGVGAFFVLASAFCFSLYMLFVGDQIARLGSVLFTSLVMILAGLMTFVHFLIFRPLAVLDLAWEVYGLFLGLAIVSTVMPVFMISEGIRRLGASNTSIIASVGPVATIGLAWLFLQEPITGLQVAGTGIVLFGVWLVGRRKDRPLTDTPIRVR
jgi:drug/metabolite transporter (DMT)-like permease